MPPTPVDRPDSPVPASPAPAGFAAQAARLVEAARANERAVRDLEEATQILAAGVDDLAAVGGLAGALDGLADQVACVRAAADDVRGACAAAAELSAVRTAADEALRSMRSIADEVGSVAARAAALDERLAEADERLAAALDRMEHAGLDAALCRIDALERTFGRVLDLLTEQADAYAARVEPRLARLEAVAERMDAPGVADGLADVLAANYLLFERMDALGAAPAARTEPEGGPADDGAGR